MNLGLDALCGAAGGISPCVVRGILAMVRSFAPRGFEGAGCSIAVTRLTVLPPCIGPNIDASRIHRGSRVPNRKYGSANGRRTASLCEAGP